MATLFMPFECISVYVDIPSDDPEDPAPDLAAFGLCKSDDPEEFAKELCDMASFIKAHKDKPIRLEIEDLPCNKFQNDQYLDYLEKLQVKFDKDVSHLGEKIRTEVIVPLCKKYKLEFTSGMGRFFFTDQKGNDYSDPYTPERAKWCRGNERIYQATKPILKLLNQEVSLNQYLGYFVGDVRKEAW